MKNADRLLVDPANVAGISECVYGSVQYGAFYSIAGARLGGFTGIYDVIINAAKVLTAIEDATPDIWEEHLDWPSVTEAISAHILACGIKNEPFDFEKFIPDFIEASKPKKKGESLCR